MDLPASHRGRKYSLGDQEGEWDSGCWCVEFEDVDSLGDLGWRKVTQGTELRVGSTELASEATREDKMAQGLCVALERSLPKSLRRWADASSHPQQEWELKRHLKSLAVSAIKNAGFSVN